MFKSSLFWLLIFIPIISVTVFNIVRPKTKLKYVIRIISLIIATISIFTLLYLFVLACILGLF